MYKRPAVSRPTSLLSAAPAALPAFLATVLIFGMMMRAGRLTAWSLLLGGPIYAIYIAAALLLQAPVTVH